MLRDEESKEQMNGPAPGSGKSEVLLNDSSGHDDQFCTKIKRQIGAILSYFWVLRNPENSKTLRTLETLPETLKL